MRASTHRHWQRGFIAGAGIACLGAGGLFVSGCTTPLTADLNSPAKKNQQVAKASSSSTAKKAAPVVAAKESSGKARVTDLDKSSSTQIVAQRVPSKTDAAKRPAPPARPSETQLASASIDPQETTNKRRPVTKADAITVAAKPRTPAEPRASQTPATSDVAGGTVRDSSSVKQTAGNRQSTTVARKKPSESNPADSTAAVAQLPKKPANRPQTPETKTAEADPLASNHERRRSDRLMDIAHERYRSGYPEEALRLASIAFELEKSGQAVYRRGEERPSDYLIWLQSVAGVRTSNPPVIRPKGSAAQVASASQSGSTVAAASAEAAGQRPTGDVIRADGGSNGSYPGDTTVQTADATRANGAVDLSPQTAPRFATGDAPTIRAGANAGQVEVPPPPTPRSADSSLAMANTSGPSLEAPTAADAGSSAKKTETPAEKAPPLPETAPAQKSAPAPSSAAFVALDDSPAEADVFAESETPGLLPGGATQLTIASLVGLITGVAGMFGLTWWRRQERRHYAAGK